MTNILTFHPQQPPLTREELLAELRGKENAFLDFEQDLGAIAEAVWPEGSANEAPQIYRAIGQFTVAEVIAGVKSLHELTDRLAREVERLMDDRDRLKEELHEGKARKP